MTALTTTLRPTAEDVHAAGIALTVPLPELAGYTPRLHAGAGAAVLTMGRPSTSARKIVAWSGEGEALERVIEALAAEETAKGTVALKWQAETLPAEAGVLGFTPMRTAYRSADGTTSVEGAVRWLAVVERANVERAPYYGQTTEFTCGAVAALLATELTGRNGGFTGDDSDQAHELGTWRRATNFPACEPIGLTDEVIRMTEAPIELWVNQDPPYLVGDAEGFDREYREVLQRVSSEALAARGFQPRRESVRALDVNERVRGGASVLLLIDEWLMHAEHVPHWIVAHASASRAVDGTPLAEPVVIVQDPWFDFAHGETWVDASMLPIPLSELDEMLNWGEPALRSVIVVGAR